MTARIRVNWDGATTVSGRAAYTHEYADITDYVEALHWRVGSLGDVPTASLGGIDIDNYRLEWVARQGRLSDGQFLGAHSVEVQIQGQPLIQCYGQFAKRSLTGDVKVMRMELFNSTRASLERGVIINRSTQQSARISRTNLENELSLETSISAQPAAGMRIPGGLWFQGSEKNFLAALGQLWGGIWCDDGVGNLRFFRWRQFFEARNADGAIAVNAQFGSQSATIQDDPVWVPSDRWLANTQLLEGVRVSVNTDPPLIRPDRTNMPARWVIAGSVNPLRAEGAGVVIGRGEITFDADDSPGEIVSLEKPPTFEEREFVTVGDVIGSYTDAEGVQQTITLDGDDAFSIYVDGTRISAVDNGVRVTAEDDITGYSPPPETARYTRARFVQPTKAGTYQYEWRGAVIRSAPRFIGQTSGVGGDVLPASIATWGERKRRLPPWVDNNRQTIIKMREDLSIFSQTFELAVLNIEIDTQTIGNISGLRCGDLVLVDIDGRPIVAVAAMLEYQIARTKVPVLRLTCLRPSLATLSGIYVPVTGNPPEPPEEIPVVEPPEPDGPKRLPREVSDCDDLSIPRRGDCLPFNHGRYSYFCGSTIRQRKLFNPQMYASYIGEIDDGRIREIADLRRIGATTSFTRAQGKPTLAFNFFGEFPGGSDNDIYVGAQEGGGPGGGQPLVRRNADVRTRELYGYPAISRTDWTRADGASEWTRTLSYAGGSRGAAGFFRNSVAPVGGWRSSTLSAPYLNLDLWEWSNVEGDTFRALLSDTMFYRPSRPRTERGLSLFVLSDGGRQYLREGGRLDGTTEFRDITEEWTGPLSREADAPLGGMNGWKPLDFAFMPTNVYPFDVSLSGRQLDGRNLRVSVSFNPNNPIVRNVINYRPYQIDNEYGNMLQLNRGRPERVPPPGWGVAMEKLPLKEPVSFDIIGWKLTGGCDNAPDESETDLSLLDVEDEYLLARVSADLTPNSDGKTTVQQAQDLTYPTAGDAYLGGGLFGGFTIGGIFPHIGGMTSVLARKTFKESLALATNPSNWQQVSKSAGSQLVTGVRGVFRVLLGLPERFVSGKIIPVEELTPAYTLATRGVSVVVNTARIAVGAAAGAVVSWLAVQAGTWVGENVIFPLIVTQRLGRSSLIDDETQQPLVYPIVDVDFELPTAGRWVIGLRVSNPAALPGFSEATGVASAVPFCTTHQGRTISDTAFFNAVF